MVMVTAALLAAGALAAAAWGGAQHRQRERGAALFEGRLPLDAAVAGHADRLPPHAAACANCHAVSAGVAPLLGRGWLVEPRARRGGPPSSYDREALCELLRTGIDPAWVLLPRTMPRYALDDADCAALWAHLSRA